MLLYKLGANGRPIVAGRSLVLDGARISNPDEAVLRAAGYMDLIVEDAPSMPTAPDGYEATMTTTYAVVNGAIHMTTAWELTEIPPPTPLEPTPEERIAALEQQIALLLSGEAV